MNLKNYAVVHNTFGKGIIIAHEDKYITVKFTTKESKFVVPDAFQSYLKCEDTKVQTELEAALAAKEAEKERQAREERERELRKVEEAQKRAAEMTKVSNKHIITQSRKSDDNNLAFKCNFCDGGCSANCIGYKGVCSDERIKYNINVRHHSWCSNVKSPCRQYIIDRNITRVKLDTMNKDSFVCYESRMLTAWIAAAGEDLSVNSGISQGRRIRDAANDSLAILTTRHPDEDEETERIIFGVFVTEKAIEGDEINAGYVIAKKDYAIELTPEEARKMKFWHYYKNSDGGIRWSQGLYRYLKDTVCARILADIVAVKKGSPEEAHAKEVLEYYCQIKGIDVSNIPVANGAI